MERQTITSLHYLGTDNFIGTTLNGVLYLWKFDCMQHPREMSHEGLSTEVVQVRPSLVFALPHGQKIYKLKGTSVDTFIISGNFGMKRIRLDSKNTFVVEHETNTDEEINDFDIEEDRIYCAHETGEVSIKDKEKLEEVKKEQISDGGMLSIKICGKRKSIFTGDDTGIVHILNGNLESVGRIGEEGADCVTSLCLDDGSNWLWTGGIKGVSQWHIDTGSFIRLYSTTSPVNSFLYQSPTNDLLVVSNDKYVLKYNRIEGLKGYLLTMSQANFSLECADITPGVELLLTGGDGKAGLVFLNRIWLIAALVL